MGNKSFPVLNEKSLEDLLISAMKLTDKDGLLYHIPVSDIFSEEILKQLPRNTWNMYGTSLKLHAR